MTTYEDAYEKYRTMMKAYNAAREVVRVADLQSFSGIWRWAESVVHSLERLFLGMTPHDWQFRDTSFHDYFVWTHIWDRARELRNGLAEMEVFGSREDTRDAMASADGGAGLRRAAAEGDVKLERGRHELLRQLQDRAAGSRVLPLLDDLERLRAVALDDSSSGTAPLGGPGIPPMTTVVNGIVMEYPWDGVAGRTYRGQFRWQIAAADHLADVAYQSLFTLRALRITYLDMIGGFVGSTISVIGALVALATGLLAPVLFVKGVLLAIAFLLAGSHALAVFTKNYESFMDGTTAYSDTMEKMMHNPPAAMSGGRWPDPTRHHSATSPYVAVVANDDGPARLQGVVRQITPPAQPPAAGGAPE